MQLSAGPLAAAACFCNLFALSRQGHLVCLPPRARLALGGGAQRWKTLTGVPGSDPAPTGLKGTWPMQPSRWIGASERGDHWLRAGTLSLGDFQGDICSPVIPEVMIVVTAMELSSTPVRRNQKRKLKNVIRLSLDVC